MGEEPEPLKRSRVVATEDLHDEALGDLRVHRMACEAVMESGRLDEGLEAIYQSVLDELDLRGEL